MLIPTTEQQNIIETAKTGVNITVIAFAGASKTTTCVMVANEVKKPSLYVAFNKSIATEATAKFPSHVQCMTMHSLAWKAVVKNVRSPYAKKLQSFFNFSDIDINVPFEVDMGIRMVIIQVIKEYCQSANRNFIQFATDWLENYIELNSDAHAVQAYKKDILYAAELYWINLQDQTSSAKITHDVYLKLFQLSNPILPYSMIYLDEAQDSNPVTLDIVMQQKHCQIILIGDTFQSIYEWRGAIDALGNLPESFTRLYLTESFRFTQEIADIATKLTAIANNDKQIIGKAEEQEPQSKAILVRTNATLLSYLIAASEEQNKVKVLADLKDLWVKLYHITGLYFKSDIRYPDKELSQFKTYEQLLIASKSMPELDKLVKLAIQLGAGGLTANINRIKSVIVDSGEDYTISTIHKSKGLEWDYVVLAEDTVTPKETVEQFLKEGQNLNMLYVAITRAKYRVHIPELLDNYLQYH